MDVSKEKREIEKRKKIMDVDADIYKTDSFFFSLSF